MSLRFKLQLVVMADDTEVGIDDVVVLDKQHERLEHIGLSLAEAKMLLLELERQVVTQQISSVPGHPSRVPELWPTTRHQRSQDSRFPNTLWQSGARQPAAATVSLPARRTVIDKPAGRIAAGAHCARVGVPREQMVVHDLLRSDGKA